MSDKPVLQEVPKVVELGNSWYGRVEPEAVLKGVLGEVKDIEELWVVFYTKDGRMQVASTNGEVDRVVAMAERVKFSVLAGMFEADA